MKKKLLIAAGFLLLFILGGVLLVYQPSNSDKLRKKHAEFLRNSPFQKTLNLSKKERLLNGIPPNKYYEQEYLLEMNPALGRPTTEKLYQLQEQLNNKAKTSRVPGDASDNKWVERGPNNVGGRTRVVVYDPNDATHKRVFAGGVSGGLWVTNDITDPNVSWTRVGIPENLAISCMTIDPNNSQIMYVGTGEVYTQGDAIGNGIYKSTNGGGSWFKIYNTSETFSTSIDNRLYFVNDIIAWNYEGSTVLFAGVGGSYISESGQFAGYNKTGLYKSMDDGATWSKITLKVGTTTHPYEPNDFDIAADNKIWFSTNQNVFGDGGGAIFSSSDGTTFTLKYPFTNGRRTQIAVSGTNANTVFALASIRTTDASGNLIAPFLSLIKTTNAFSSTTTLKLPNDEDTSISADDFTRGQAFYDLTLEVDPTNDNILYAGGIDLFRSTDGGTNLWPQISKWSNNNALGSLNVSTVHADQHALTFDPTDSNKAVLGTDGGVYYASNLASAATLNNVITSRNKDFNVTQFYKGAIGQDATPTKELFLAGAQDNGSQLIEGLTTDINVGQDIFGGDGAYEFIDKDGAYMIVSYVYNSYTRYSLPYAGFNSGVPIIDDSNTGQFINPATLDDNLDILYTDGSTSTTNRFSRYSNLNSPSPARKNYSDALLTASPTAFKVSPYTTTSSTLFIGTMDGKLLKVINADTAVPVWSDKTGLSFVGSVSSINFGANENEILVTFHNYGVTNIWYTSDGGTTWLAKDGDFPDIPVKAIMMNPLNPVEVIIGTNLGVWRTQNFSDPSPNWTQSENGMSNVKVTSFDYRTIDNTVLASTYGRGIFTGQFKAFALAVNQEKIDNSKIIVNPTVSNGSFSITSKVDEGKTSMKIFDITGKQVYSKIVNLNRGTSIPVNVNIKSGLYFLNLTGKKIKSSQKIIIK